MLFNVAYAQESIEEPIGNRIAKEAAHWIGSPYGNGNGNEGYGSEVDCSGLVYQVYKSFGVELPRASYEQATIGELIPLNEMIPGDIVCFVYEDGSIGHVGIYIGGRTMIHSPRPGKTVEFSHNFEEWNNLNIKAVYGRRIDVISEYFPEELPADTSEELYGYLQSPNNLTTEHLNGFEFPDEDLEEDFSTETVVANTTIILQIDNPIMLVNGEEKTIDDDNNIVPLIINDRTHLPLRNVAEELGADVEWIGGEPAQVTIRYNDCEISLWIEKEYATVNGQMVYIDSSPLLTNNKTYLPIRFIADEFGWNVKWDGNKKTVILSNNISDEDYSFN